MRVRMAGLSFPENLGALPVTLQHYAMDSASKRRAAHELGLIRLTLP